MTESRMVNGDESGDALPPQATPEPNFYARAIPYAMGTSGVLITDGPDGRVIGSLAMVMGFGQKHDRATFEYWAARLTRALNNGYKAEQAIARLLRQGGEGKINARAFAQGLDRRQTGGKDGIAIRGDKESSHS